ncbi:holin [Staphylococcus xylosus]
MEQIIAFAGIISVITIALTEVIKRTKAVPKNFIPIVSMVIGIVTGGITIFIPEIVSELSVAGRLLAVVNKWTHGNRYLGNIQE